MDHESHNRISELEQALASVRDELQRRRRLSTRGAALLLTCGICVLSWAAYAQSSIRGTTAPDEPLEKISRRVDALQRSFQDQFDRLELRVRKLEQAPQQVDSDENPAKQKGSAANGGNPGKGNAGDGNASGTPNPGAPPDTSTSSASQAIFNLIKRVTALENRHVFTAPFVVDDKEGHALLTVDAIRGEASALAGAVPLTPRGLTLYNDQGQPAVRLSAYKGGGGSVRALSTSDDDTWGGVGIGRDGRPILELMNATHIGVWAEASSNGESYVAVKDSDGHTDAELRSVDGKRGQVGIFHGDTNIAALTEGTNGAILELDDMSGVKMVEAGTLPDHTGIVRTGPASRAPGGLMGVPGSYITGKGQ